MDILQSIALVYLGGILATLPYGLGVRDHNRKLVTRLFLFHTVGWPLLLMMILGMARIEGEGKFHSERSPADLGDGQG